MCAQFAKIGVVDYDQVKEEMDIFQQELLRFINLMQEMSELAEEFAEIVREIVRGVEVETCHLMKRILPRRRRFACRFHTRWHTAATGG